MLPEFNIQYSHDLYNIGGSTCCTKLCSICTSNSCTDDFLTKTNEFMFGWRKNKVPKTSMFMIDHGKYPYWKFNDFGENKLLIMRLFSLIHLKIKCVSLFQIHKHKSGTSK